MASRKQLQKRVENHIKDLSKRGIDPSLVTLDKSIESLAWNTNSYNAFMERKRIALRKQKKKERLEQIIVITNNQGYDINKYEYDILVKLQDKYNKKLQQEYKKYIKKYGEPGEITKAFLLGQPIRHKNSGENIQLPENFGDVNLINRINENVNIEEFKKLTEMKIKQISFENMTANNEEFFSNEFLKPLVDSFNMHEKEMNILIDLYKRMNIVERYQFNKDMKRVMQIVESDTRNPISHQTPYYLIREFMEKEYKREFLESY